MYYVPTVFNNRNNFVDDVFEDMFPMDFMNVEMRNTNKMMNADVKELKDEFQLELEVPGFNKNEIKAEVKDGYLTVNALHTENKDEKNKDGKYIRRERYTGKCQRSFYVGENVNEKDIKAKFQNGILTIDIPKKKEQPKVEQKKYIAIEG